MSKEKLQLNKEGEDPTQIRLFQEENPSVTPAEELDRIKNTYDPGAKRMGENGRGSAPETRKKILGSIQDVQKMAKAAADRFAKERIEYLKKQAKGK